jgi:hypothetical protein
MFMHMYYTCMFCGLVCMYFSGDIVQTCLSVVVVYVYIVRMSSAGYTSRPLSRFQRHIVVLTLVFAHCSCAVCTHCAHIAHRVNFKNVEQSFNDSRTHPAKAFFG